MFFVGDRVVVLKGSYEGCIGKVFDIEKVSSATKGDKEYLSIGLENKGKNIRLVETSVRLATENDKGKPEKCSVCGARDKAYMTYNRKVKIGLDGLCGCCRDNKFRKVSRDFERVLFNNKEYILIDSPDALEDYKELLDQNDKCRNVFKLMNEGYPAYVIPESELINDKTYEIDDDYLNFDEEEWDSRYVWDYDVKLIFLTEEKLREIMDRTIKTIEDLIEQLEECGETK